VFHTQVTFVTETVERKYSPQRRKARNPQAKFQNL